MLKTWDLDRLYQQKDNQLLSIAINSTNLIMPSKKKMHSVDFSSVMQKLLSPLNNIEEFTTITLK